MPNRAGIALIFLVAACQAARGDNDCGRLKIIATVSMQPLTQNTLRLVPVRIDGVRETMLLDTGGSLSQVSQATVDELSLKTQPAPIHLYNMYGNVSGRQALVRHFEIGNLQTHDIQFQISPVRDGAPVSWRNPFALPMRRLRSRIDGVLALDLMANYDIELDFGGNILKYVSPDHCAGHVVYWDAPALAVVPMQLVNLQITIPVTLDGHALTALIDTGSARSMMSLDTARDIFGLTPGDGLTRNGYLGGQTGPPLYTTTMRLLTFEGVEVKNPVFDLIPDLMRQKSKIDNEATAVVLPQLLLGMDILRKLHLYIAFQEKKIYITEAAH